MSEMAVCAATISSRPFVGTLSGSFLLRRQSQDYQPVGFAIRPKTCRLAWPAPLHPDPGGEPMAYTVTFIPGDGVGPELSEATRRVLEATAVEFEWDVQDAGVDVMDRYGT